MIYWFIIVFFDYPFFFSILSTSLSIKNLFSIQKYCLINLSICSLFNHNGNKIYYYGFQRGFFFIYIINYWFYFFELFIKIFDIVSVNYNYMCMTYYNYVILYFYIFICMKFYIFRELILHVKKKKNKNWHIYIQKYWFYETYLLNYK